MAGHAEEVLLGPLDALLDRERDLVGLAVADAHDITFVADDDQRGEGEAAAALDDLGDAVDLHDALLEVQAGLVDGSVYGRGHGKRWEGSVRGPRTGRLDLDPGLSDRVGEGGHMAVVAVPAAVEHGARDPRRLGALGEQGPGAAGGVAFARACAARARTS